MDDLHLFLTNARKAFDDAVGSVTIVMGNEASDMDSVVTSIIYAYLCSHTTGGIFVPILSIPSEDLKLRTDQYYLFKRLGFNYDLIIGFSESVVQVRSQTYLVSKITGLPAA